MMTLADKKLGLPLRPGLKLAYCLLAGLTPALDPRA